MQSKIDILKIKSQLPHGAQSQIAKKLNVSLPLVNRVLNGKSDNSEVLSAIADYLIIFKEKKNKAISRLSSLID